jgi:hypothetical protein
MRRRAIRTAPGKFPEVSPRLLAPLRTKTTKHDFANAKRIETIAPKDATASPPCETVKKQQQKLVDTRPATRETIELFFLGPLHVTAGTLANCHHASTSRRKCLFKLRRNPNFPNSKCIIPHNFDLPARNAPECHRAPPMQHRKQNPPANEIYIDMCSIPKANACLQASHSPHEHSLNTRERKTSALPRAIL